MTLYFSDSIVRISCNFIKKETLAQVFSCEFCEISKKTFFDRTPLVAASVDGFNMIMYRFYTYRGSAQISTVTYVDLEKQNDDFYTNTR